MSTKEEFHQKLTELTQAHLQEVAGGSCTVEQISEASSRIVETYENLIDATSYIIERVLGS
jgi:hypothetical protein